MIETVVSVDLMVEEELKVKKNHLAPDFPTGEEKRICIVSGLYGDELQGQYISVSYTHLTLPTKRIV